MSINMTRLTAAGRLKGRIRAIKRRLGKIYTELCRYGCKTEGEAFFADNYHTVFAACEFLLGFEDDAPISADMAIGESILKICGRNLPPTDDIISEIRRHPETAPNDIDNIRFILTLCLLERIYSAVKNKSDEGDGQELPRLISVLADMGSLDEEEINAAVNPVAIALSVDSGYSDSDALSKRAYRKRVYRLSCKEGLLSATLAAELAAESKSRGIRLTKLLGLERDIRNKGGYALAYAGGVAALSLALSGLVGYICGEPLAWLLVLLPAMTAVKSVVDSILIGRVKAKPILRLDCGCERVKSEKCAIVLSAALKDAENADSLYDRLYKLYAANSKENILITAVCDLPAEQVPITSDDRAIIDSLGEVIQRLNACVPGRFSCIVRKRRYSASQDEYMGWERKRGAIIRLCRYMSGEKPDFYAMLGDCEALKGVGYICAVDFDTEPGLGSVSELMSVMLHPANIPEIDGGRVIKGCGIVAPAIVTRLKDSLSTGFSRGMGGIGSVSGYERQSLDFWQQVFSRGSFCGKGLISVEALLSAASGLPEGRILSHDILEGELAGCLYVGDVYFTEGFPKNAVSYFKRLDRWVRGDIQNIAIMPLEGFDGLARLKLIDNIRRAVTPISLVVALYSCFFLYSETAEVIALFAVTAYFFPYIYGLIKAALCQGGEAKHFFPGLLSQTSVCLVRLFYESVMLHAVAIKSFSAICRALFRMARGSRLLDWTTSAAADSTSSDPIAFFFMPELSSLILLASPCYEVRLFSILTSMMPVVLILSGRPGDKPRRPISYRDTRELSTQLADMWKFYSDYVTESESYLPPDNVQFAPVYRICHRTSPTNIGMYMLSVLAACDRRLITIESMEIRLRSTLSSIEKMEKYKGNLYNWYETKTLALSPNPYVSSVDSGNFVCSLVALKEGLKEYLQRLPSLGGIISRIERIIADTDLGIFYDRVKGLMAIGINPKDGSLSPSKYDFLMSEARLMSYYAIASSQVPKSHWLRLRRTCLSNGFYSGCASYSGTMFEYFMPELFLKSPEGSVFSESLKYALMCQRSYAQEAARPYGISESGYYAFDGSLSYRYMAHGVPKTGLKRGLWTNYVVSPYSSYISLGYAASAGIENLNRLKKYGMYSRYGFYEALDFTAPDSKGEPETVKSYMAHHVGMSIIALMNILGDGIMQKRFMRDAYVMGASELLDERVMLGRNIYEDILIKPAVRKIEEPSEEVMSFDSFSPFRPRTKLLRNGSYTLILTDCGASKALYRGKNVYSATKDGVMRPKGIFFGVFDGAGAHSLTLLPDMSEDGSCEFGDSYAAYYKNTPRLNAGMRVTLHKTLPCEIRSFALENTTKESLPVSLYSYIEPSLADDDGEEAHPAYKKMFIRPEIDPELGVITVTRSDESDNDRQYIAIGFAEDILGAVSFDREDVLSRPEGVAGLFDRALKIEKSYISEPDPCVFIRTVIDIPPESSTQLNMFILCCDSREELTNGVSAMKMRYRRQETVKMSSGVNERLADRLLADVIFPSAVEEERKKAISGNRLPLNALWELSVATHIPLILLRLNNRNDREKLSAYLGAYRILTVSGIRVQLAVIYDDGGSYQREHYTALVEAAKEANSEGMLYSGGGIIPIDLSAVRAELAVLLEAYACHVCKDEILTDWGEPSHDDLIRIRKTRPSPQRVERRVALGGFDGESYVINEKPRLPWCHVLSSHRFGTLISDSSLGFTYAFNSRELRLTPWDNDTARDNCGERLILKYHGGYIDLISGSAAVFSPYKAEYFFKDDGFEGNARVRVSEKGMVKKLTVNISLDEDGELAYYCEPCLGFNRRNSALLLPKRVGSSLVITSCAQPVEGFMAVSASKECRFVTSRRDFLCGSWQESIGINADTAAAAVCKVSGREVIEFYLSYALDENAAVRMPSLFIPQTDTRETPAPILGLPKDIDPLVNHWLRYQALHARIWARTGFYQCSGAYGFRDQLQDACGILAENPGVCKAQILRCCMAQFVEGDVMHWWHTLPGKKPKGIRTRISDDNLWLPYAVCEYIEKTGDRGILELRVRYCSGISLREGERESYGEAYYTALRESVFEHCKRAIDYRLGKTGKHGLMLIGTGDWNDGFNRLGEKGLGESVWLTEFFILVLKRFAGIAGDIDSEYSEKLAEHSKELETAIEQSGRGEKWYLRAYSDDGSVIGSENSESCRIDSIAQSFASFAELRDGEFTRTALREAYSQLADVKRGVIKLFTPAFKADSSLNPGYISHYPEGLRENGGQYTHGAVWLGMALMKEGMEEEGREVYNAINPIRRSHVDGYKRYKTEPYYLAGDVYTNKNCYSRGGWSIYTGSAAWYYRALREAAQNGQLPGDDGLSGSQ